MDKTDPYSGKALAVAVAAVSKSMAALFPAYGQNLAASLVSAEGAGLPAAELALLRLLVNAAASTQADPEPQPS